MRYVTATEAADMTGLSERTIRRMIAAGTLPARRVNARRYEIAVADLPERKADPLAALQAEVAALRREVDALKRSQARSDGHSAVVPRLDPSPYLPSASAIVARPSVSPVTSAVSTFRTHADAARWLVRHGIKSEKTPSDWTGWRDVPLEPRAVLLNAISRQDATNWRISWRLSRCDDASCVCAEML